MRIYRIVNSIYANKLIASGKPARWNSKGVDMLYFAQSVSLACLENAVHRSSIELQNNSYTIVTVEAPDNYLQLNKTDLPKGWNNIDFNAILKCRPYGDKWIQDNSSVILRVPSVIVPGEYNFLVNPKHRDFIKIKVVSKMPFNFDRRMK